MPQNPVLISAAGLHTKPVCLRNLAFRRHPEPGAVGGGCSLDLDLEGSSASQLYELHRSSDREGFDASEIGAPRVGVLPPSLRASLGAVYTAVCSGRGGITSTVDPEGEIFGLGSVPPTGLLERLLGARDILASTGHDGLGFGASMHNASGPCFEPVTSRSGPSAGGGHTAPSDQYGRLGIAGHRLCRVEPPLGGAPAQSPRRAVCVPRGSLLGLRIDVGLPVEDGLGQ